ncbi:hypothetical protein [Paenibacillus spongiae]|uniref:Uncharacterized protein n=1 Tax=Paenibacillus spongiae TaxID=2909671 RepID=A0ABY5S4G9_9BACL|nr:hypothetical protein [Paenibacillus spongiae]UVI28791.1 hypothetical protein L1F29_25615 [Paenibacillus spongiae]
MSHAYARMNETGCGMAFQLTQYDGARPIRSAMGDWSESSGEQQLVLGESLWDIRYSSQPVEGNEEAMDCQVTFKVIKGSLNEASVSVGLRLDRWSQEDYLLMPAAAYNGNRFRVSSQAYPPMLTLEDEIGVDIPTTITDVPRLNRNEGPSKIELRTGDLATPAVGCFLHQQQKGLFMLTYQRTALGDSGLTVEENDDRSEALISIAAPAVRNFTYSMCNAEEPSGDRGYDFQEQDEVTINFRLYMFDCPGIPSLFDYFTRIRKDLTGPSEHRHEIPFSTSWDILEEKYNRDNWQAVHEFYRSSTSPDPVFGEWQTGWVGGAINTYPMLAIGSGLSKARSIRTLNFMFDTIQAPSGFFYGIYCKGNRYGDAFRRHEETSIVLLRKNADVLYFMTKQLMLLDQLGEEMPANWKDGLIRACDAFVRLWNKYGQFGQFIDLDKEEILIGGSAGAAIAPAGLTLAGQYFNRPDYIAIAKEAGQYYYEHFMKQGVTTGAPGEICQCPDSESAFALLESYVVLYEATGDRKWLGMAEETAKLCATWVVSYDYEYAEETEFRKLDLRSSGAVWASVQNKHASPGICTFSGVSLFKLYRATANEFYLELLQDIAHNLPQYMSREDRPLRISWGGNRNGTQYSRPGWMGERVNLSDWEGKENIGEVAGGSCWCEVSNMLTYLEVPGVYIQPDTGNIRAIDHVDAEVVDNNNAAMTVKLTNPTHFTAKVRIFVENSLEMKRVLGENALLDHRLIVIGPSSEYILTIDK